MHEFKVSRSFPGVQLYTTATLPCVVSTDSSSYPTSEEHSWADMKKGTCVLQGTVQRGQGKEMRLFSSAILQLVR